ncbi:MAG: sporulation/spore germination protein [Leptolyngbya sp. SIO4C1]|nr:sporulation/spore germination protein [Leptolyngbya sp. SIO4C1]
MLRFPKSFLGIVLAASVIAAGCDNSGSVADLDSASTPTQTETEASTPTTEGDTAADAEADVDKGTDGKAPASAQPSGPEAATDDLIEVPIYVMDEQCNDFVQETVRVHEDKAMDEAVGKVIASTAEFNAFDLAGYRVNLDESTGMVVIDLRLSEESQRQFVSLSSCEQRALFGSVEETLLKNSSWDVKAVEFTARGEELVL